MVTGSGLVFLAGSLGVFWHVRSLNAEVLRAEKAEAVAIDRLDEVTLQKKRTEEEAAIARAVNEFLQRDLLGQAAIANARLAYARFREIFSGSEWETLAERGAAVQRPLWASTSTKNPRYRDVRYVEELVGPDTVNTLPPATLEAFKDHGHVSQAYSVGTTDMSVSGPILEVLRKVK